MILVYGSIPVTHDYLLNTYRNTNDLLVISSTEKLRQDWKSLPNSPMVLKSQDPELLTHISKCQGTVILEQAQNFKDLKLEDILSKHKHIVYTHSHLFKQLTPEVMKSTFTKVVVTKTRFFNTIATVFNIPLTYGASQSKDSVQVFSNTGEFLSDSIDQETPQEEVKGEKDDSDQQVARSSDHQVPRSSDHQQVARSSDHHVPRSSEHHQVDKTIKYMTLTISMDAKDKDAFVIFTKKFSKNVFTKEIRVHLKGPSPPNTYCVEVKHEPQHGAMVCMWLYHLSTTMTTELPIQALHISFS
jgi:hypothetical protein